MDLQFAVDRKVLLGWFQGIIKSFVFSNQMHDIFKCVRFTVSNGVLTVEASDTVSYVKIQNIEIDTKFDGSYSFLILAEAFHRILVASEKKKTRFKVSDNSVLIITEGRYKLPLIADEDYTVRVEPGGLDYVPIEDLSFVKVLNTLVPFAAKELVRPELAGVTISDYVYASTVGNYGVIHKRVESIFSPITIFPYAIKFIKAAKDESLFEEVRFSLSDSGIFFKGNDFFYTSSIPSEKFPYEELHGLLNLLSSAALKVTVSGLDLQNAFKRVLLLDVDRFSRVSFKISKERLLLTCISEAIGGDSSEDIAVEKFESGDEDFSDLEFRLSMPSIEAFRRVFTSSELITFYISSEREPLFIKQKGSKYIFYTVMMRSV